MATLPKDEAGGDMGLDELEAQGLGVAAAEVDQLTVAGGFWGVVDVVLIVLPIDGCKG